MTQADSRTFKLRVKIDNDSYVYNPKIIYYDSTYGLIIVIVNMFVI